MKENLVIQEIRKARESISKKCDFDSKKLVDYYIERQKKEKNKTLKKNTSPVAVEKDA